MEIKLYKDEKIEDLQYKGLKIIQNKKWFCFGMDAVLLSDFAKNIKTNSTVVDLGAGTGIISILLSGKTKAKKIICVEKQKEMAEIINKNIQLNNLQEKLELKNIDVLELPKQKIKADVIVTNPPYKKKDSGIENENKQKYISKFETTATLEDFIITSNKILKDKGKLFMVHRPERLTDILFLLRKHKLEPKRIQFVYSHINPKYYTKKEKNNIHKSNKQFAKLVLIEAVKNANPFLKVEENIYVYDEAGNYTEKIKEIYNQL